MASANREKLITVAHDLFYEEGFHTVGIDRIIDEVGVTKTTFYNHFESKDDLIIAVLVWHDKWWREEFIQLLRRHGGDKPRDQLLALGDALNEMFSGNDESCEFNGCMFVNVSVAFPLHHDPAHQAAIRHKQSMEDIVRELAGYAGADDPKAFAQEYSMLMEGAYVTQLVTGDPQTADIARRIARLLVEKHLPE
jgi:AcrR family transcriptional regulator